MEFHCIDTVQKYIKELYCDNIYIDATPEDAVFDHGDLSTMQKKQKHYSCTQTFTFWSGNAYGYCFWP